MVGLLARPREFPKGKSSKLPGFSPLPQPAQAGRPTEEAHLSVSLVSPPGHDTHGDGLPDALASAGKRARTSIARLPRGLSSRYRGPNANFVRVGADSRGDFETDRLDQCVQIITDALV